MSSEFEENKYYKVFQEELDAFREEGKRVDELYDETHALFDKKINKNGGTMFGNSSGDRDAIEISKNLSTIRQTKLNVIKEQSNVKKIIAELSIKEKDKESEDMSEKQLAISILEMMTAKNNNRGPVIPKAPSNAGIDMLNVENIELTNIDKDMVKRFRDDKNKK